MSRPVDLFLACTGYTRRSDPQCRAARCGRVSARLSFFLPNSMWRSSRRNKMCARVSLGKSVCAVEEQNKKRQEEPSQDQNVNLLSFFYLMIRFVFWTTVSFDAVIFFFPIVGCQPFLV
nr:hypothetical protein [Pandoravirus aubagnensis]